MKIHYLCAYELQTVNSLTDAEEILVLGGDETGRITTNITQFLDAYSTQQSLVRGIMSIFTGENAGGEENFVRIKSEIFENKSDELRDRVFLLFESHTNIHIDEEKTTREFQDAYFGIDLFDQNKIREFFRPFTTRLLLGTMAGLPEGFEPRFKKIGDVSFSVKSRKRIHSLSINMGPVEGYVGRPIQPDHVPKLIHFAQTTLKIDFLKKVSRLFASSNHEKEPVHSFLSAWTALESLISSSYKHLFRELWKNIDQNTREMVLKHVIDTDRFDKYGPSLVEKFLIGSAIVGEADLSGALVDLKELKRLRDNIVHGDDLSGMVLPKTQAMRISQNYLRHLLTWYADCQQDSEIRS